MESNQHNILKNGHWCWYEK